MARLYSNENFPLPVVEELRRLGHDVLTIRDSSHAGQAMDDDWVLDFAAGDSRAVLTLNRRHFVRLHHEKPDHAGIITCTVDRDFIGQATRIHTAIAVKGDLARQLVRINRPANWGPSQEATP